LAGWAGLLDDLDLARALTYDPRAWGDYQWAIDHLAGRSLASKVIRAVDAPDRIAFMRFVPEVASASRVFEAYLTAMTFLTLVRVEDGTWRVWGLGPGIRCTLTHPTHRVSSGTGWRSLSAPDGPSLYRSAGVRTRASRSLGGGARPKRDDAGEGSAAACGARLLAHG